MTEPKPGQPETLGPGLRRVLAPNPGPMTHSGTNTFIVGTGEVAIVDPGPESDAHFEALMAAVAGVRVTHILITHAHLDHSELAPRIAAATGAPVSAFGAPEAGRSETMERLASEAIGGGEGVDEGFVPDIILGEGDEIELEEQVLTVMHTPGHFSGHLSFALCDGTALTGDHVMAWASSLVSPPDGDVAAFRATTERMRSGAFTKLYPAHGPAIDDPHSRLSWLLSHRDARERAVLEALSRAPARLPDLTARIYTDTPTAMHPAAARNVLAHLVDLWERGHVNAEPNVSTEALWSLR